jgi:hypothetical protein
MREKRDETVMNGREEGKKLKYLRNERNQVRQSKKK